MREKARDTRVVFVGISGHLSVDAGCQPTRIGALIMKKNSFLKTPEAKPATKVLSVRIPEELHSRITSAISRAQDVSREFDLAGDIASHLIHVVGTVEKELVQAEEEYHQFLCKMEMAERSEIRDDDYPAHLLPEFEQDRLAPKIVTENTVKDTEPEEPEDPDMY